MKIMKRALFGSFWLVAVVAFLLCWTSAAFAQSDPQFAITGVTGSLWGEYTSPYGTDNASVGSVVCDDFKDTVYIGTEHNYTELSANSIIASGTGGIWSPTSAPSQIYAAAAALVLGIQQSSGQTQEFYNWALWALFDPTDALNAINSNLTHTSVDMLGCNTVFGSGSWNGSSCTGGTGGLIGAALANGLTDYGLGDFNNLAVYVPFGTGSSSSSPCTSPGHCDSQEFWGTVPDGGSALLYLVIAGVSCFGTMFRKRNRTTRASLA